MKTKFHPILFSTPMVQAILEGRKTQTRRIIKKKFSNTDLVWHEMHSGKTKILVELQNDTPAPRNNENGTTTHTLKAYKEVQCPYNVGDVLWVRETWQIRDSRKPKEIFYKASDDMTCAPWKPSIFMPKHACRIFLKIKSIRVERLYDISNEDAIQEGISFEIIDNIKEYKNYTAKSKEFGRYNDFSYPDIPKLSFISLWESINGKESLELNPFVWVYEFEQIEKPLDFI